MRQHSHAALSSYGVPALPRPVFHRASILPTFRSRHAPEQFSRSASIRYRLILRRQAARAIRFSMLMGATARFPDRAVRRLALAWRGAFAACVERIHDRRRRFRQARLLYSPSICRFSACFIGMTITPAIRRRFGQAAVAFRHLGAASDALRARDCFRRRPPPA